MKPHRLFTVEEILSRIESVVVDLEVHGETHQTGIAQTSFSYSEHPYSIVLATNQGWLKQAAENDAVSLILTTPRIAKLKSDDFAKPLLLCQNPDEVFYFLHNQALHAESYEITPDTYSAEHHIDHTATIHPSVVMEGPIIIGEEVTIGPFCYLKGPIEIGAGTIIQEGCSIGNEGLFTKLVEGHHQHIRHYGGVVIGPRCQIHSGARIARSAIFQSATRLEEGVSVGVESVVGHDCHVERNSIIASTAAILGRAHVEASCWIGAGSLISNSCRIGHHSSVKVGAVVIQNLEPNSTVSGNFAREHHRTLRDLIK
ncbi:MAG: hypothetical protein KDA65_09105 [Planctomycetaceae bacterium]|nr:hypothetical protein [Planctomycetaceae bacterium]